MTEKQFKANGGFTIWELLCIILIIFFLAAIMMPSLSKVKKISTRVVCGTNLKGLGTAVSVYANDYDDWFPRLPGQGEWSRKLGFAYDMEKPQFGEGGTQHRTGRTISASWYLLVRQADVSPKSFVCSESNQTAFGYQYYSSSEDITRFWDFGEDPYKHVSYSMHNPYGRFPAKGSRSASFAYAGDMSPWFEDGDIVPPNRSNREWWRNVALFSTVSDSFSAREQIMQANSMLHNREGQNVMFADGHLEYVKSSDVGVKHDNIYTFWSNVLNSIPLSDSVEKDSKVPDVSEADKRIGTNPTSRSKENDAKSTEDSFLAI